MNRYRFGELLEYFGIPLAIVILLSFGLWWITPVKVTNTSNIFQIRENDGFKIYKFQDHGVDCYVSVSKVHNQESISCVKRDR